VLFAEVRCSKRDQMSLWWHLERGKFEADWRRSKTSAGIFIFGG